MAGSAAGAKNNDKKAISNQTVRKFEGLINSITVANGKAKVKYWAKLTGKSKVDISVNGRSLTYTAQSIAKEINEGVEKGYWKLKKSAGELSVDLTEKGRRRFYKSGKIHKHQFQPLDHCDGKKGVEGDSLFLDDDATDEIQWGSILTGGVFTIAAAIAGVIAATALAPAVLAAAAVLATVTAAYITIKNEGCGIEVDTDSDSVKSQHCDC